MIYRNGNVEFQVTLNKEEAIWWQNRVRELGSESEILSRNFVEILSVEGAANYLIDNGKQIFREALRGSKVATSVYQAYCMFHDCPGDPGGQAFLEIAVNDYIRSKKFTLNIKNPGTT